MKHNDTVAVVDFKAQVDRMADFLAAAGYDVKRTHLVEAGARFQGARDWRTLRAELESKPFVEKSPVPDLGGKSVRVYFDVHACSQYGESPRYCWTDINQSWVNRMYELRGMCKTKNLSSIDDDFDVPDWMDDSGIYRIQGDGLTVSWDQFWFYGHPKHADYRIETHPIDIDAFIGHVQSAIAKELYFVADPESVDDLMAQLERDEDDADFASSADEALIFSPY